MTGTRRLLWLSLPLAFAGCFGGAYELDGPAPFARMALNAGMPAVAAQLFPDAGWRGIALYRAGDYPAAAAAFWTAGKDFAFNRGDAEARAGHLRKSLQAFENELAWHMDDEDAAANKALVSGLLFEQEGIQKNGANNGGSATRDKATEDTATADTSADARTAANGRAGRQQAGAGSASAGGSSASRSGDAGQSTQSAGSGKSHGGAASDSEGAGQGSSITDAVIAAQLKKTSLRRLGKSFEAQAASASTQWLATLGDDPGRYLQLILKAEHDRRAEKGIAVPDGEDP